MNTERIYGFDIIRLIAFLAIVVFHSSWAIWLDPSGPPDPLPTTVWKIAEFYARVFSFSGFTVIFLSSFLIGFKAQTYKKNFWLPFFLIAGWLIFCFCTYLKEKSFSLEWDIYPLLIVGLISGQVLLKQSRKIQIFFALLSITLLAFPIWKTPFLQKLPFFLGEVLVGQCPQDYADWPIFPWVGLMWLGMIAGFQVREAVNCNADFRFRNFELPLGIFIVVYYWFFKTAYFQTNLGDGWSCFTFRQEPQVFWAHMLLWMGLMRVSLHPSVQNFLKRNWLARAISSLEINRNFFLAYLMHYLVLFALIGLLDPEQNATNLYIVDAIFLLVLPMTELTSRALLLRKRKSL